MGLVARLLTGCVLLVHVGWGAFLSFSFGFCNFLNLWVVFPGVSCAFGFSVFAGFAWVCFVIFVVDLTFDVLVGVIRVWRFADLGNRVSTLLGMSIVLLGFGFLVTWFFGFFGFLGFPDCWFLWFLSLLFGFDCLVLGFVCATWVLPITVGLV